MIQKVFRTGNSLAVTIPSGFASVVGIRAGEKVNVKEIREKSRIILQFSGNRQLLLDTSFLKSGKK
ncbi:MAG: AbrB/MazE/SpoVT family DNA-binding domain-containing protein [Candidatus Blackburnbacteria bacterium]|nr:AbrB/MazE/SpoVT family DNA-binding domain-containing protein [Candidatus Blackburnbacteria bacterium]